MVTIAMVIQPGADTCDFAGSLAKELECEVVDNRPHELLFASTVRRNRRSHGSWFQSVWLPGLLNSRTEAMSLGMHNMVRTVVRSKNVLLVGWHAVLSLPINEADIRVLIHGPRMTRTSRLAAQGTKGGAGDVVRAADGTEQKLSAILEALYGRDWTSSHLFDLAINSSRCTPQVCGALIRTWLERLPSTGPSTTEAHPSTAVSHPIALTADLDCPTGRKFAVVERERVDLSSVQSHEAAIAAIEQCLHQECHRRHD